MIAVSGALDVLGPVAADPLEVKLEPFERQLQRREVDVFELSLKVPTMQQAQVKRSIR